MFSQNFPAEGVYLAESDSVKTSPLKAESETADPCETVQNLHGYCVFQSPEPARLGLSADAAGADGVTEVVLAK